MGNDGGLDGIAGGVTKAVVAVLAIAAGGLNLWWTFVAFFGGTMPLLGWERPPSIVFGILWLVILEPIALTILYWVTMLITLPLYGVLHGIEKSLRNQEAER
jgi:hypothetical protein